MSLCRALGLTLFGMGTHIQIKLVQQSIQGQPRNLRWTMTVAPIQLPIFFNVQPDVYENKGHIYTAIAYWDYIPAFDQPLLIHCSL